MKALVFESFGEPAEVLQARDLPMPEPGPGEVRVRMIASPINPSDLMVVRGRYGVLPQLPATPGFEGVGIVDSVGPGLNPLGRMANGKRVTVINSNGGNWAEFVVIPARQARPVPADIPDEQVASFFVNPATALAMVRHVLRVPRGAWLLQTAAGSELGRMIIRLGKHDGFKTLNVVRRPEARSELEDLGGDAVICSADGPIDQQVRRVVAEDGVRFAIDPVGGATGSQAFQALGSGGRMLEYGSLSGEPLQIDSRPLISRDCRLAGFWLGHWMRSRSIPQVLALFRTIADLMRRNVLTTQVGEQYWLERIAEAVRAAEQPGRPGKVLLRFPALESTG
jgi:NADPH:quinone reductase-like Zn-dependent oxidoreductase